MTAKHYAQQAATNYSEWLKERHMHPPTLSVRKLAEVIEEALLQFGADQYLEGRAHGIHEVATGHDYYPPKGDQIDFENDN